MEGNDFFCNTFEFKLQNLNKKSNRCSFSGYASIFDVIDSHNDVITKDAFLKRDKCRVIPLLWQHEFCTPIGKVVELKEDDRGLHIVAELCMEVHKAQEVFALLRDKIISGLSIGYTIVNCEFEFNAIKKKKIRKITDLVLWEVSLVTFPANCGARIMDLYNNPHSNQGINKPQSPFFIENNKSFTDDYDDLEDEEEIYNELLRYIN